MKELIECHKELGVRHDQLIQSRDLSVTEERLKHYEETRPLIRQQTALELTLHEVRRGLAELVAELFNELGSLARLGITAQVIELAGLGYKLSRGMYETQGFDWEEIREEFESYQKKYRLKRAAAACDYSSQINGIRRGCASFLQEYCERHRVENPLKATNAPQQ